ncbi:hypothetical protein ACJX0J_010618, partial [Zea mays]
LYVINFACIVTFSSASKMHHLEIHIGFILAIFNILDMSLSTIFFLNKFFLVIGKNIIEKILAKYIGWRIQPKLGNLHILYLPCTFEMDEILIWNFSTCSITL